jgi:hypothetical protein
MKPARPNGHHFNLLNTPIHPEDLLAAFVAIGLTS